MPPAIYDFIASLTYPLYLTIGVAACGVVALILGWRMLAGALVIAAILWSLVWSVPQCSDWLRATLERRYPVVDESKLARADAIVVLGGGTGYEWLERTTVRPEDLRNSRLAAGARAWLSGRAPVIILSGGGENGRSEAGTMAAAIARLGVPASALVLEDRSRNTRDNALFTAQLARKRQMSRVLLVTSSLHMPRASYLFRETGIEVMPVPVPERALRKNWKDRWLPTRSALWRSGRALKEYAGLIAAYAKIRVNTDS